MAMTTGGLKPAQQGEASEMSLVDLLNRALQISIAIYNREAGGAMTHRQFAVLNALDGHDGVPQTDLARLTGIDRSTLAELVGRMEKKGLLRRESNAADAKILDLMSLAEQASFVRLLRTIIAMQDGDPPEAGFETAPLAPQIDGLKKKKKSKYVYVLENCPCRPCPKVRRPIRASRAPPRSIANGRSSSRSGRSGARALPDKVDTTFRIRSATKQKLRANFPINLIGKLALDRYDLG